MRFQQTFTRTLAGSKKIEGKTMLGSDPAPTGPDDLTRDCAFASPRCDINGFPIQRVIVGYLAPTGDDGGPLPFEAYVYDDLTRAWFRANTTHDMLKHGHLVGIDTPSLIERAGVRSPVEVYVRVMVPKNAQDGEHRFVFGADVSNPGI